MVFAKVGDRAEVRCVVRRQYPESNVFTKTFVNR